jgi:hypothetical protein
VYYEAPCPCGQTLRGERQRSRQILSCPRCGRKRFIAASSPWLAPADSADRAAASARETTGHLNSARFLLVIVLGGVAAMALIFLLVRPYLRRPATPTADADPQADIRTYLEAAEHYLRDGNVHLALRELNAASALGQRHPEALHRAEHQSLEQLRRQSDLLAHLLDHSLEEIARLAMQHHDDEEWRAKFADYRGRSVVFDDVLRRDARGQPILSFYVVRVGDIEARVAVDDLLLLRQLPLDPPRRWLFGGRLADCRREEGGRWVLHFEPDSAVLLTDDNAAAACCPAPLDEELRSILKRQDKWLQR